MTLVDVAPYRRREPRIPLQCTGTLIEADGSKVDVNLINVSRSGFAISTRHELVAGDQVYLDASRSPPIRGKIVWTAGDCAGGMFLDRIVPA